MPTGIYQHKPCSEETKIKIGLANSISLKGKHCSPRTEFKKGTISCFKGKKRSNITGRKHYAWKGDNVGYSGIHMWVKKQLGQPNTCEHCGKTGLSNYQIHWHSKNHEYKRILTDWIRLCAKCHKNYNLDKKIKAVKQSKKTWLT